MRYHIEGYRFGILANGQLETNDLSLVQNYLIDTPNSRIIIFDSETRKHYVLLDKNEISSTIDMLSKDA